MKPEEISTTFSSERIGQDASGQTPYTLNRILAEIALQLATINESISGLTTTSEPHIETSELIESPIEPSTEEPQHKRRGRPPLNRKEESHA